MLHHISIKRLPLRFWSYHAIQPTQADVRRVSLAVAGERIHSSRHERLKGKWRVGQRSHKGGLNACVRFLFLVGVGLCPRHMQFESA